MTTNHVALARAREGRIGSDSVANYLASMHFLVSQTVPHLERARAQAKALGMWGLVPYFERKLAEEAGHEKWAARDLDELSRQNGHTDEARPLPAVARLVDYVSELIDLDPRLYLVYALCNEYFTVLAGPTWVRALITGCNVPEGALTVVTGHVEADRSHSARSLAQVDELIADAELTPLVASTVNRTMDLFDQFFQEVVTVS